MIVRLHDDALCIVYILPRWSNKPLAPNCIRVPDGIRSIMTRAMTVAGADVAGTEIIESSLKSDVRVWYQWFL